MRCPGCDKNVIKVVTQSTAVLKVRAVGPDGAIVDAKRVISETVFCECGYVFVTTANIGEFGVSSMVGLNYDALIA